LEKSERPILYFGNGIRISSASEVARKIVELSGIPFALSWSAIDLIESEHPLNIGRLGLYGDRATNILLQRCDFFLSIGSRLAIPQVGYDKNDFGRNASKWVVDIDPTELTKFPDKQWNTYCIDARQFLDELLLKLQESAHVADRSDWIHTTKTVWDSLPRYQQIGSVDVDVDVEGCVHSVSVVESISRIADDNAVIVTDVGAGLLSGHYAASLRRGQRMFTSQGLGEMGFGLPGAIGAYFASPDRQLLCLNTDGGIMFNLQELQLVAHHKIPLKLFVFNNNGYAMIRISQDNLFKGNHQGSGLQDGISFPHFEDNASAVSLRYSKIDSFEDVDSEIISALNFPGACLIEVIMSPAQKYLPRLATSKLPDGTLISPPLEDMDPLLPIEQLERLLGYQPQQASYTARGLIYE
jgi:acetolactate synthase-1/2/3 large subunit